MFRQGLVAAIVVALTAQAVSVARAQDDDAVDETSMGQPSEPSGTEAPSEPEPGEPAAPDGSLPAPSERAEPEPAPTSSPESLSPARPRSGGSEAPLREAPEPQPRPEPADPAARPGGSVGIGAGYSFPGDIRMPSIASVRFRWPSGLTLEPQVRLAYDLTKNETLGSESESSQFETRLGTALRVPVVSAGPVDLIGIGVASFRFTTQLEGGDRDIFGFDVGYGLGLELFFNENWSLSLNALNPILQFTKDKQGSNETTQVEAGVVFDPNVQLMAHLYL